MELKNIVIDRGNSTIKAGFFHGHHLVEEKMWVKEEELFTWLSGKNPEFILASTVAKDFGTTLESRFSEPKILFLNSKTPLPFNNLYKSPETLGVDRLAGIAGAFSKFPNENCLVIDAGTCITYDFIDDQGNYWGGGISPGLRMKLKALNHFTEKLPLVAFNNEEALLIGDNTQNSILSGVFNGTIAEIEGIIKKYRQMHKTLRVLVCGGDTIFFESKLKEHIFAFANLVLVGLNSILIHNIKDFEAVN